MLTVTGAFSKLHWLRSDLVPASDRTQTSPPGLPCVHGIYREHVLLMGAHSMAIAVGTVDGSKLRSKSCIDRLAAPQFGTVIPMHQEGS